MRWTGASTSILAAVVTATSARAEAAEPEQAPSRGSIDLRPEAPSAPVARSYRVHDGFYVRGGVGFGWTSATFDYEDRATGDLSTESFDFGFDLLVGGSPTPGLTLGGAFFFDAIFAADFESRGRSVGSRDLGVVVFGPFIDAFPDPKGGWHLGGAIGLAGVQDQKTEKETNGIGAVIWGGHDFWVGGEWSIGPLARLGGTVTRDLETDDPRGQTLSLMFLVTGLYH